MNKDASDFMLEEYSRISAAYFGLREQTNEMLKSYLTVVGLALTVMVAVLKVGGEASDSPTALPWLVSEFLVVVAILGFFIFLTVMSMRMSMIRYGKTINALRRYFAEVDQVATVAGPRKPLADFLVLPTNDRDPRFLELGRTVFWQLSLIGFLDGAIAGFAAYNLFGLLPLGGLAVGGVFFLLHMGVYVGMAWYQDATWHSRFSEDVQ